MADIIPAILPKSYEELADKLDIVAGHAPVVQIDICDGGYTPGSRTWPYLKGLDADGRAADQIFEEIVSQEKALPHWDESDFEFDLMVKNAYDKIPDFISAGATRVVVHLGSFADGALDVELANIIRDFGKHSEELGPFDVELGLALMPGGAAGSDAPDAIARSIAAIAPSFHFIQVMGIAKVGFQGQTHDPRSIELVRALRARYPDMPIAVDGAVDRDTAPLFISVGADRLVVGSALFESDDFLGTIEEFRAI